MSEKKGYEIPMTENTGCCPYCGQLRIVNVHATGDEEEMKAEADKEAMLSCDCREGEPHRQRYRVLEAAEANIEELFAKKQPEVAEIFRGTKEYVYDGHIDKLSVQDTSGGTASMKMTGDGLKLEYRKTNRMELTTGF